MTRARPSPILSGGASLIPSQSGSLAAIACSRPSCTSSWAAPSWRCSRKCCSRRRTEGSEYGPRRTPPPPRTPPASATSPKPSPVCLRAVLCSGLTDIHQFMPILFLLKYITRCCVANKGRCTPGRHRLDAVAHFHAHEDEPLIRFSTSRLSDGPRRETEYLDIRNLLLLLRCRRPMRRCIYLCRPRCLQRVATFHLALGHWPWFRRMCLPETAFSHCRALRSRASSEEPPKKLKNLELCYHAHNAKFEKAIPVPTRAPTHS